MPGIRGRGAVVAVVTAAFLTLIAPSAGATGLRSTFNNGAEGWTAVSGGQPLTIQFLPVAGNPGGHIAAAIPQDGLFDNVTFIAPDSWTGNRVSAYGGAMSFDIHLDPDVSPIFSAGHLSTGSPDFAEIQFNLFDEPGDDWQHFNLPLRPGAGWIDREQEGDPAGQAAFVNVLSNLEFITVSTSGLEPGDTFYLDNVVLAANVKRELSIGYRGGKFGGKLKAAGKCAKSQAVTVFRKKGGPDAKAGSDKTNAAGRYSVSEPNADGKYYAVAKKSFENGAGNCLAATSKSRRVR